MSKYDARNAMEQLIGRPSLIAFDYAAQGLNDPEVTSGMMADIRALGLADPDAEQKAWVERRVTMAEAYGFDAVSPDKPFIFSNGYALIPIHGMLLNRFNWSWGFWTGYNFIRNQVIAAIDDDDVEAIIFDVNSYGGTVAGCQETAELMWLNNSQNGGKLMVAVVDANCYSAAYYLSSQCDHIAITPSGGCANVGVLRAHMDMSKMMEDIGIKITFIYAGAMKVAGNPYEPLDDDVRAEFQAEIDAMYDTFVAAVARGRGLSEKVIRDTEARCYSAQDALDLELVDDIQNPADAVEAYFIACEATDDDTGDDEDDDPPEPTERTMAVRPAQTPATRQAPAAPAATAAAASTQQEADTTDTAAVAAQVAADARTAERTRIQGIQTHAEAVGREDLASYLALETDMSVEAAGKILARSPKVVPDAKPAETTGTKVGEGAFAKTMTGSEHPTVGAGAEKTGEGDGDDDTRSPAKRILATQMGHGNVTRLIATK